MSEHDHRAIQLDKLATESRNPATANIDQVSTLEMVTIINDEDHKVAEAVRLELPNVAKAVDVIVERINRGGRLIYTGAGTSGRLGVLDASECPPTYSTPPGLVVGIMAGGDYALRNSVEATEDSKETGAQDLQALNLNANDTVVGIAASGRTPYVIGALEYARSVGAAAIGLCNTANSELSRVAEITIAPVVGGEVVTGSTRMKSGTAQKLVLNMLSTGTMIKLGKTYGNLMVDMQASNAKLRKRSAGIIVAATGVSEDEAEDALARADGSAKTAIVSLKLGISAREAEERLTATGGFVRAALGESGS